MAYKGKGSFDTGDLDTILGVFEEVWGKDFRDRVHAIPAFPASSENYKKPCRLINRGKVFVPSAKWKGFYPRLAVTVSKIRSIQNEQYMLGLFDTQIASVDIDAVYDCDSRSYVPVEAENNRQILREMVCEEIRRWADRFIIEDSSRGFHLFFWCRPNEYFSQRGRYIVIGERLILRYDVITCRPQKCSYAIGKADTAESVKPAGGYTLLGYGKNIPGYTAKFVGKGRSLDRIPWQFTSKGNNYETLEQAVRTVEYAQSLQDMDYRASVKREIFEEWFLNASHSRDEEQAMERMVDRYIQAVKKNEETENDKGFTKDRKGRNTGFKKLTPETSVIKVDSVRRATIESVYKFYDHMKTMPAGTAFDSGSALEAFIEFCKENDLELRGLWDHRTGELLFSNRFYKVMLNLANREQSCVKVCQNRYSVAHADSPEPQESDSSPASPSAGYSDLDSLLNSPSQPAAGTASGNGAQGVSEAPGGLPSPQKAYPHTPSAGRRTEPPRASYGYPSILCHPP